MDTIKVNKKVFSIAEGSEIVLRETQSTKMVFLPMLIDDPVRNIQGVRGKIVLLKKGFKEGWEKYTDVHPNNMKAGEWTQIELHTEEAQKLFNGLQQCNLIVEKYGVESAHYSFFNEKELTEKAKAEQVLELFSQDENLLDDLLEKGNSEIVGKVFKWLSKQDDIEPIVDKLNSLDINDLDKIHSAVGLANLKKVMAIWEENKDEKKEEKFWQDVLKEHSWILSQIFSTPTVLIQTEAYVGGKAHDNKGGRLVDFLFANPFSKDSVLIEIKTPQENLLASGTYRTNLYPINEKISGAVLQVLKYKSTLQQDFSDLLLQNYHKGKTIDFDAINPSCVVIAGRLDSLTEVPKIQSFEFYRKELGTVTLITFDELFDKVRSFIDLLETN